MCRCHRNGSDFHSINADVTQIWLHVSKISLYDILFIVVYYYYTCSLCISLVLFYMIHTNKCNIIDNGKVIIMYANIQNLLYVGICMFYGRLRFQIPVFLLKDCGTDYFLSMYLIPLQFV